MIHGVYFRTNPKTSWILKEKVISSFNAGESANRLEDTFRKIGQNDVEVAIQYYDSILNVPEILPKLKPYKPYLN